MGPAAWAAVGRALGLALATSFVQGRNSLPILVDQQVRHAINQRDLELARVLLADLRVRHRRAFEEFLDAYSHELPPEALGELRLRTYGQDGQSAIEPTPADDGKEGDP